MEVAKTLFADRVAGGSQLNREGIMALLSDIYDIFGMEQFEILSFKSRGETIKEWWDSLDNTELLTWDFFEKKGKDIIAGLPSVDKDMVAEKDEKTGKYQLVPKSRVRKASSGKSSSKKVETGKDLNRTYIPTSEIVGGLSPYLEKVWDLFLAFKEPNEETVRPYLDYVPLVVIWVNNIISVKARSIPNFEEGFADGLALIAMIEVLSGVDLKGYNPRPTNQVESFKNITLAMKFATHFKVDVSPVTHNDIYYGNFEKLIILLVRIGEKWITTSIDDKKGKVASSPLIQSNNVELKVDQKEQDEIYRLASLAQTTKKPEKRVAGDKAKAAPSKGTFTVSSNVFTVDMGSLGKEEIPYQQTRLLGDILQELCKKHNISDMDSYIACTLEGSELFLDSMLGEIPKSITFLPAQTESKGTLADLINKSDIKAQQKRLQQVVTVQRNYEIEDEDEMESRKRQLQRANAFDKVIDESISNNALDNMRKEYEKLMDSLQLDKLRAEKAKKATAKQAKPASKIQEVDMNGLNQMVVSLDNFQKAYGTSEAANNFFAGLL